MASEGGVEVVWGGVEGVIAVGTAGCPVEAVSPHLWPSYCSH